MLQRFRLQDNESTPNTKPRRAPNDADDGLGSIIVCYCWVGLKQEQYIHCWKTIRKLYCSRSLKERCVRGDIWQCVVCKETGMERNTMMLISLLVNDITALPQLKCKQLTFVSCSWKVIPSSVMNLHAPRYFLFLNVGWLTLSQIDYGDHFQLKSRSINTCAPKAHEKSRWKGTDEKVRGRTEAALTVSDNKDNDCILRAQRLPHATCLSMQKEHLPGEWVASLS